MRISKVPAVILAVLAVCIAGIAAVAILAGRFLSAPEGEAIATSPTQTPSPAGELPALRPETPRIRVALEGETDSARSILAAYWGKEWERLEPVLKQKGYDLDAPLNLPPWESVGGRFESMFEVSDDKALDLERMFLAWPEPLTAKAIADRYGAELEAKLGAPQIEELDRIASDSNDRMRIESRRFANELDAACRLAWQRQDFLKAPLCTDGLVMDSTRGRAVHAAASATEQWAVKFQIFAAEFPQLEEIEKRIRAERNVRDARIVAFLRKL